MAAEILEITVNESLVDVEAHSDDVLCIVPGVLHDIFERELLPKQSFFIVGQLDDQWHVEDVLEPAGELEWDGVSDVHTPTTGTTACIEEEVIATLVAVEYPIKVAVTEEQATS